jgi:hypothetical protein
MMFGILLAQEIRNFKAGKMRLEGQEEMMRADQPLLLDTAQRFAHDAAQRRVSQCLIADEVLGHTCLPERAKTKRHP